MRTISQEWLYWGKKHLISKYPTHIINDKEFKQKPSKSMIIGFEGNFGEPPVMIIIMEPYSKQTYIYPYIENKMFITRVLKDKEINKVVFSRSYIEGFIGSEIVNARDLCADIEDYYDDYCPNFVGFLNKLYKQNFTFTKQQNRYLENGIDNWTQNYIFTGVLQVIGLYEMMLEMRENNKTKKRRIN